MKKEIRKCIALCIAAGMTAGLTACGNGGNTGTASSEPQGNVAASNKEDSSAAPEETPAHPSLIRFKGQRSLLLEWHLPMNGRTDLTPGQTFPLEGQYRRRPGWSLRWCMWRIIKR